MTIGPHSAADFTISMSLVTPPPPVRLDSGELSNCRAFDQAIWNKYKVTISGSGNEPATFGGIMVGQICQISPSLPISQPVNIVSGRGTVRLVRDYHEFIECFADINGEWIKGSLSVNGRDVSVEFA